MVFSTTCTCGSNTACNDREIDQLKQCVANCLLQDLQLWKRAFSTVRIMDLSLNNNGHVNNLDQNLQLWHLHGHDHGHLLLNNNGHDDELPQLKEPPRRVL